jgi:hypothetical protein
VFVYLAPVWLISIALCWIPPLISKHRNPSEPIWGWIIFGLACLPLAIVFALVEKPAGRRRTA